LRSYLNIGSSENLIMARIERILCPIDLSPQSDEALRYSIALARAYGAVLYVCHSVVRSPSATHTAQLQLDKLVGASICEEVSPIHPDNFKIETIVVEGDPAMAITQEAAARRVDLIVIRSRRRPLAAALLGSTAEAICRTAPCPVLVTHPRERELVHPFTGEIDLRRLLVAYDFSDYAELALSIALSIAQEYQAELHLIHVLPPQSSSVWPPSGSESVFQQALRRLHNAVPSEAGASCEIKATVCLGQPYREILDYAEEKLINLICMGASGSGFGLRALFGSNADRVLRQAPCPVLIARPLKPASVPPPTGQHKTQQP
jgi:nucleotide-binding universal stress UspA family protein